MLFYRMTCAFSFTEMLIYQNRLLYKIKPYLLINQEQEFIIALQYNCNDLQRCHFLEHLIIGKPGEITWNGNPLCLSVSILAHHLKLWIMYRSFYFWLIALACGNAIPACFIRCGCKRLWFNVFQLYMQSKDFTRRQECKWWNKMTRRHSGVGFKSL